MKESQTENQNDVHEENLNEHGSSEILENSFSRSISTQQIQVTQRTNHPYQKIRRK